MLIDTLTHIQCHSSQCDVGSTLNFKLLSNFFCLKVKGILLFFSYGQGRMWLCPERRQGTRSRIRCIYDRSLFFSLVWPLKYVSEKKLHTPYWNDIVISIIESESNYCKTRPAQFCKTNYKNFLSRWIHEWKQWYVRTDQFRILDSLPTSRLKTWSINLTTRKIQTQPAANSWSSNSTPLSESCFNCIFLFNKVCLFSDWFHAYFSTDSLKKLDALNYSSSYISNAPALKDFINKYVLNFFH